MQADALTGALVGERFHDILFIRRGVHDVVVRLRGVPHRKAVVVAGSDRHVLGSGILESLDPLLGVVAGGVEGGSRVGIFVLVQMTLVKVPLTLRIGGVDAPMQEYSEAVIDKLPTCLKVLRGRLIMVL